MIERKREREGDEDRVGWVSRVRVKKQKGGSRRAGWKCWWKGEEIGIIRLSARRKLGRVRGQSLVRVQVVKRKKISENTKESRVYRRADRG